MLRNDDAAASPGNARERRSGMDMRIPRIGLPRTTLSTLPMVPSPPSWLIWWPTSWTLSV